MAGPLETQDVVTDGEGGSRQTLRHLARRAFCGDPAVRFGGGLLALMIEGRTVRRMVYGRFAMQWPSSKVLKRQG